MPQEEEDDETAGVLLVAGLRDKAGDCPREAEDRPSEDVAQVCFRLP